MLRPCRDTSVQSDHKLLEEETPTPAVKPKHSDLDYNFPSPCITGEKTCIKMHTFPVSTADYAMADRCLVSVRQQSEMLKSTVG